MAGQLRRGCSPSPETGYVAIVGLSQHRVVIDTDIGTDVDDLWTLAMVPGRPDMDLVAVTVVYGDTRLRARLASLALAGMGLSAPVARGMEDPMSGRCVMWAGYEGVDVPGLDDASTGTGDAVGLLCDTVAADPCGVDVVAIAPLTNIAAAIRGGSSFSENVKSLFVMGGEFSNGWAEHNVSSDIDAARIVFGSGVPITVVPLDQTLRVLLSAQDLAGATECHPLGALMADQADRFWAWLRTRVPGAPHRASPAHDPCALLALLEPDMFEVTPMAVTVDDDGRTVGESDRVSPVGVVTDLDPDRVRRVIIDAIKGEPADGC